MTENSNLSIVLDEMAVRAGAFYRKSNENYMEAAAELVKARDLVPHGGWGPWLQKARIPGRTATRMMRLHRAGIKSATVANIGVGRIDELLGRYESVGMPEGTDLDECVRFNEEVLDPAWTCWIKTAKNFEDFGRDDLRDRIDESQPTSFCTALAWAEWAAAARANHDDPETYAAKHAEWIANAPWKFDYPCHEPEPDQVAYLRCATEYVKEYLAKMDDDPDAPPIGALDQVSGPALPAPEKCSN